MRSRRAVKREEAHHARGKRNRPPQDLSISLRTIYLETESSRNGSFTVRSTRLNFTLKDKKLRKTGLYSTLFPEFFICIKRRKFFLLLVSNQVIKCTKRGICTIAHRNNDLIVWTVGYVTGSKQTRYIRRTLLIGDDFTNAVSFYICV